MSPVQPSRRFSGQSKQRAVLPYRVSDSVSVAPHQVKGAIDVAHFGGHVLKEPFERGGRRQVQRDALVHRLGIGGVLDDTQHPGLLCSTFCLQ